MSKLFYRNPFLLKRIFQRLWMLNPINQKPLFLILASCYAFLCFLFWTVLKIIHQTRTVHLFVPINLLDLSSSKHAILYIFLSRFQLKYFTHLLPYFYYCFLFVLICLHAIAKYYFIINEFYLELFCNSVSMYL